MAQAGHAPQKPNTTSLSCKGVITRGRDKLCDVKRSSVPQVRRNLRPRTEVDVVANAEGPTGMIAITGFRRLWVSK